MGSQPPYIRSKACASRLTPQLRGWLRRSAAVHMSWNISSQVRCVFPRPLVNFLEQFPPSVGREGIREIVWVDRFRVSHTNNPKCDRYFQHETPPATFILVIVRGIPVRCRCSPRPRRVLEESRTFVQGPSGPGSKHEGLLDQENCALYQPQKRRDSD